MDYSLLLAIHKVEETQTSIHRYKRSNSEPATDKPSKVETPSGQLLSSPEDTQFMSSNGQRETTAGSPGWIPS